MAQIPQPVLDALQTVYDDQESVAALSANVQQANQAVAVAQNAASKAASDASAGADKLATDKSHFEELFQASLAGGQ